MTFRPALTTFALTAVLLSSLSVLLSACNATDPVDVSDEPSDTANATAVEPATPAEPLEPVEPVDAAPAVESVTPERLSHALISKFHDRMAGGSMYSPASLDVMENPDSVLLYSLVTSEYREFGYRHEPGRASLQAVLDKLASKKGVHGSLELTDRAQLATIVGQTYEGLLQNGPVAGCFEPRHAIVYARGDARVISLICFQCHYLVTLQAEPPETQKSVRQSFQDTTPSLRDMLNGVLRDAGIKIAK